MGYSRPGEVQSSCTSLHKRFGHCSCCIRHYKYKCYTILSTPSPFLLDSASFDAVDQWIEDVRAERGDDVVIVLTGNKLDLEVRGTK